MKVTLCDCCLEEINGRVYKSILPFEKLNGKTEQKELYTREVELCEKCAVEMSLHFCARAQSVGNCISYSRRMY